MSVILLRSGHRNVSAGFVFSFSSPPKMATRLSETFRWNYTMKPKSISPSFNTFYASRCSYIICYNASLLHYGLIYWQFCKEIDAAWELFNTLCVCVYINHLFTTCNTCESQCKYCSFRSLCACYLSLFIATIDYLESTHVQVGQAGALH